MTVLAAASLAFLLLLHVVFVVAIRHSFPRHFGYQNSAWSDIKDCMRICYEPSSIATVIYIYICNGKKCFKTTCHTISMAFNA